VNGTWGLRVVFQAVIGGGKFKAPPAQSTRMQHRDALVQIVFDVFYEDGHEQQASDFLAEMRALWGQQFPAETGRMFWGTYEDEGSQGQLDMSLKSTQDMYYDSHDEYLELQEIKRRVDPKNVFRTGFTVQP